MSIGGNEPLSYYWEFIGDPGMYVSLSSSTEQNPTVGFSSTAGDSVYADVRLTVTDSDGDTDVIEKTDYIYIQDLGPIVPHSECHEITASFSASPKSGVAPLTVNFTDISSTVSLPLNYEWDFDNDGTVDSTDENPTYVYSSAGTYAVKLTVTDSDGRSISYTKADYITVSPNSVPVADFAAYPTEVCVLPTYPVHFTNKTTGGNLPLTFDWDFDYYNYNNNDATDDSTDMHPVFDYYLSAGPSPISFSVKLTVTDADGDTDTIIKDEYVTADGRISCTMECTWPPVLLSTSEGYEYHYSVQSAYDSAEDYEFMLIRDTALKEDFMLDINKTLDIQG